MRTTPEDVNTPDTLTDVGKPSMVMRSIRVPLKLWEAAKAVADRRQENISDVVREALTTYVENEGKTLDRSYAEIAREALGLDVKGE